MGRDVASGRLSPGAYPDLFSDIHPPLSDTDALVEASRCYFCHDAPCTIACPTGIDIPMFIRQILTGDKKGAATTIFQENILGGMCARVCPTEELCEEACVRNEASSKPIKIGLLQRHATDHLTEAVVMPFERAKPTGKKVAVVGAGPAGLSCAHRLAVLGHAVDILDARPKAGGLNEYGIAAYKTPEDFAQREVDYVLSVGGITLRNDVRLGSDVTLDTLRSDYDAVFLGLGMGAASALGMPDEAAHGVVDAIDYIEDLRQAKNLADLPVGRQVVVIGGGMTAIDVAIQSKRLGAEDVTIVYRRGPDQMKASDYECELAQMSGVTIRHWAQPSKIIAEAGELQGVEFERTRLDDSGRASGTGESFTLPADMLFKAIGQQFVPASLSGTALDMDGGRIAVDEEKRTSLQGVWAGGDCVAGGLDLTVDAVQDGKLAAQSIHRQLSKGE